MLWNFSLVVAYFMNLATSNVGGVEPVFPTYIFLFA